MEGSHPQTQGKEGPGGLLRKADASQPGGETAFSTGLLLGLHACWPDPRLLKRGTRGKHWGQETQVPHATFL